MQLRPGNVPEAEKSYWEIPTSQLGQFPNIGYLFELEKEEKNHKSLISRSEGQLFPAGFN